jgi:hypothetical protein
MKDGLLGISVVALILGGLVIFQRSVDAHHPWWVFVVEGIAFFIGLALVHHIGEFEEEDEEEVTEHKT